MPSNLVQVSPKEYIRRNPGESDADVRRRWATEEKATSERISRNAEDSRFYKKREQTKDFSAQIGMDISRALGKRYAKGGSTASKRADGCATKGKTKGRFV